MNALLHCLGTVNPLYAALGLAAWVLFGDRIKSALGGLWKIIPSLPVAPAVPTAPADPKTDLNAWLEQHPLLDRLWVRMKEQFATVADGKVDEDTLYARLLDAIKKAGEAK